MVFNFGKTSGTPSQSYTELINDIKFSFLVIYPKEMKTFPQTNTGGFDSEA